MRQLQTYSYTIPAFGSLPIPAANDNFIILAATGTVTVRGDTFGTLANLVAGQGLKMVPFNRLELIDTSGAPNTVTILLTPAEFVNQVFSGSVSVVGDLGLNAATLASLTRPTLPTGSWNSTATMVANTPLTIFTAAANVNGAILLNAESVDVVSSNQMQAFVAKATAPATVFDGEVITSTGFANSTVGNVEARCKLTMEARIAPGLGLFFISSVAGVVGLGRHARYVLL